MLYRYGCSYVGYTQFTIVKSSWWIGTFIIIQWPSLSLSCFLKPVLSNKCIPSNLCFHLGWLPFICNIFFLSLHSQFIYVFKVKVSLLLAEYHWILFFIFVFIYIHTFYVFWSEFKPFTFQVNIDKELLILLSFC